MQATPRRIISLGSPSGAASPAISTVPDVGAIAPVRILMSVDLPAPLEPISARTSPGMTVKSASLSATKLP